MKRFFIVVLLLSYIHSDAQYVSLTKKEIGKLRKLISTDSSVQKIYHTLETQAAAAFAQEPDPIDTIISEGHLVTDPKKIRTNRSLADMNKIYALSITGRVADNKKYIDKSIAYIKAWATINHGTGNPINDTKLDGLLEGYDLVKEQATASDRALIETWLRQVANAEINHPRFKAAVKSAANNWNSHRIKIVGNIAYLLNDKSYKVLTDTTLQLQLAKNLYANGSGMDFEERDALHYHIYTLEPLIAVATTIKRADGRDYYDYVSASGSSLKKSVAFLVPFATGEKTHQEFVNSKTAFDRQRAANKEAGYAIGADFERKTAAGVLSQAAYFEPGLSSIVNNLLNVEHGYANWRSVLNAVMNPR